VTVDPVPDAGHEEETERDLLRVASGEVLEPLRVGLHEGPVYSPPSGLEGGGQDLGTANGPLRREGIALE
jgi:hypothetical protein